MKKVGVTGGIGSGKTTFCREWEKLGAYVIYADDLAKQIMVEDEKLIKDIKSTFGEESYHSDGSLNRAYLAEQAFESGRVEELNQLVHPRLWKKASEIADQKMEEGIDVFVKEAAILLKNGRPEDLDYVIVLTAGEENRIQRVAERDKSEADKIQARIQNQQSDHELIKYSDYVVSNDGTIEELKLKAKEIFLQIKEL